MFLPRILICFILVICSAGKNEQNSTQMEIGSSETFTPATNTTSTEQVTGPQEITITGVSTVSSTTSDNDPTRKTSIETGHDIEITGTASPPTDKTDAVEVTTVQHQTTETDNFTDASEITTTEKIELVSVCSQNPCKSGGTCVEDATVSFMFSCICPPGYVGIRCGTVDKCMIDDAGRLCTNGACIYSEDGLLRSCACFSGRYWDETKKECKDPDPPCFPNPCMNGGICSIKDGVARCDCPSAYRGKNCSVLFKCGECENGTCILNDDKTTKYCKCDEGLYWNEKHETCEVMMSPCDSNPCLNGGMCDAVSDTEFNCSCQVGFSGKICEITDKCSEDKDCVHGVCVLSDNKFRSCRCSEGFYLKEQAHTCKAITNVCQPNPCLNDGICTVVSTSSFNCTCSQGYLGKKCDVRDLCDMDGGNAYCGNGTCNNNHEQKVFYCICKEGEYFHYTQRKCVELDMCPLVQCDTTEECLMGECKCKEHYKWNNKTQKCVPDFCSSHPCPLSEMVCEEGSGSTDFKCFCPEGFSFDGDQCKQASCIFPKLNLCNQYCSINQDGYECSCAEDFQLQEDNHTCSYTGNGTCSNKTCDNGACVREGDVEVCICPPGFTEIDGICKDICSSGGLAAGVCPGNQCEVIHEGDFRCKCEGKLSLSKDKTTCTVRNICKENEIGWKTCRQRNAECIVDWLSTDGYQCVCGRGQVKTEGGMCRDICSLENNQRQCSIKSAICDVDDEGRMLCKCPPYFKANERDGKCTRPAAYSYVITLPLDKSTYLAQNRQKRSLDSSVNYRKIASDVTITMQEMFTSFTQANILSCKTMSELTLCKIELQFITESKPDLKRLLTEDICLRNGISNACLLPPSLVLVKNRIKENVHIQPTDPCDEDIKNYVCGSETTCASFLSQKSFNCSCKPGYFVRRKYYPFGDTRSIIQMCSDIDECAQGNPCPANSNCKNTIGSYTCSCKPAYRIMKDASGTNSQKCVEVCRPNPCMHGHCSRRGDHEFDCRCQAGYAGTFCNLQDEHFKSSRINTIIVGVVLGGALLITLILFAACISRLRKKKMIENTGQIFYSSTEMTERRRGVGGAVNNAFQRE